MSAKKASTASSSAGTAPLAMVQVPMQEWKDVYEPDQALKAGTIFAELDKPFFGGDKRG